MRCQTSSATSQHASQSSSRAGAMRCATCLPLLPEPVPSPSLHCRPALKSCQPSPFSQLRFPCKCDVQKLRRLSDSTVLAQVSDLRRLLEMYRIWQQKHFPLHGFDEALGQIADIGKTNQLKASNSHSCNWHMTAEH